MGHECQWPLEGKYQTMQEYWELVGKIQSLCVLGDVCCFQGSRENRVQAEALQSSAEMGRIQHTLLAVHNPNCP